MDSFPEAFDRYVNDRGEPDPEDTEFWDLVDDFQDWQSAKRPSGVTSKQIEALRIEAEHYGIYDFEEEEPRYIEPPVEPPDYGFKEETFSYERTYKSGRTATITTTRYRDPDTGKFVKNPHN